MKTYITPAIASKGTVTEATRASTKGTKDPINPFLIEAEALGSVGFQL
jgi:hypothetical protein